MKYDELVTKLRTARTVSIAWEGLMNDAADAIEELDAEETRLLLITSELQDKVVELEEELNDVDIAADDNARQVEELQAEVQELKRLNLEIFEDLPKMGEWIRKDAELYYWHECSKCGERPLYDRYANKVLSAYCPNCGADMRAKTEVQE